MASENILYKYFFFSLAEYCHFDTFRAQCSSDDDVLMVTSALYGRMTRGKCIDGDYGVMGCYGDALTLADSRCSGRRSCKMEIPDRSFDKISSCPKDLAKYLDITYDCVKGRPTSSSILYK